MQETAKVYFFKFQRKWTALWKDFSWGKKVRKEINETTDEERTKLLNRQKFKIEYDNFMPTKMKSETKWANF